MDVDGFLGKTRTFRESEMPPNEFEAPQRSSHVVKQTLALIGLPKWNRSISLGQWAHCMGQWTVERPRAFSSNGQPSPTIVPLRSSRPIHASPPSKRALPSEFEANSCRRFDSNRFGLFCFNFIAKQDECTEIYSGNCPRNTTRDKNDKQTKKQNKKNGIRKITCFLNRCGEILK